MTHQRTARHTKAELLIETRQAPAWAWAILDETISMDCESSAFDEDLREEIYRANEAVTVVATGQR